MPLPRLNRAQIAVLAAPMAAFVCVRLVNTPAPSIAATNTGSDVPIAAASAPRTAKALTPEQARAATWLKSLDLAGHMESPLDHPTAALQRDPEPPPVAVHNPEPKPVDPPPPPSPVKDLRLSAVLGNAEGALAMINGRTYRVGDLVKPGCTLTNIDARASKVELTLADGTKVTLGRDH